jgi:circadian clock protein KaiB
MSSPASFQSAPGPDGGEQPYVLRLYVAGDTPLANRCVGIIREMCEKHLPGRYSLEVLDLLEEPEIARIDQIVAAPTLVRVSPDPVRRLIGDFSNTARLLACLGHPGGDPASP